MIVRRPTLSDLAGLAGDGGGPAIVSRRCWAGLQLQIEAPDAWALDLDGRVVGLGGRYWQAEAQVYEAWICVARGMERHLLRLARVARSIAAGWEAGTVVAFTDTSRPAAERLTRLMGFVPAGPACGGGLRLWRLEEPCRAKPLPSETEQGPESPRGFPGPSNAARR